MDNNQDSGVYDAYVLGAMAGGLELSPKNFIVPPSNPFLFGMWLGNAGNTGAVDTVQPVYSSGSGPSVLEQMAWTKGNRLNALSFASLFLTFLLCAALPGAGIFIFMFLWLGVWAPLHCYIKAVMTAREYGSNVKVRFGFKGAVALALTFFMIASVCVVAALAADLFLLGGNSINYASGKLLNYHLAGVFGLAAVVALPITLLVQGWYARRVYRGKKAMPAYMKVLAGMFMLGLLMIVGYNLLQYMYAYHRPVLDNLVLFMIDHHWIHDPRLA
ncbi:TPA: hypothetical protein QDB06_000846 [Burkholderia vietnamiensis]|nr:hypothetical protein [Burkholderia vietnamiensis]